jgi:DNA-binding NarL/FixJ family response regulator
MGTAAVMQQEASWYVPVGRRLIAVQPLSFGPSNLQSGDEVDVRAARLTRRERQICQHIREGLANKQIASRLGISTHTVKCHVHSALVKLGLASRVQIAVMTGQWDEGSPRLV